MERRDFLRLTTVGAAGATAGLALLKPSTAKAAPNPPRTIGPRNWWITRNRLPAGTRRTVLIAGGGLAGLSAALELSDRGYEVTVREAAEVLGGRLSTRDVTNRAGTFRVEHGLHMWFDNYHVFREIRQRLGIDRYFRSYDSVHFTYRTYQDEVLTSRPAIYPLNLLGIVERSPNLELTEALANFRLVTDVMHYNHGWNYRFRDNQTFADWASGLGINRSFYDVLLQPAASVTLNDPNTVSAAEMIMYMHLYFISQPHAMDRDITTVDHATAVIDPWQRYLAARGVRFELSRPLRGLRFEGGRAVGEVGSSERFDYVVLATHVPGTQSILNSSTATDRQSEWPLAQLRAKVGLMRVAPPYKVLRVWLDRPLDASRPDVLETPQHAPINLVAQYHLLEDESRAWAARTGGSILEFHLYANPALARVPDAQVWPTIRPVALELFPELASARLIDAYVGSHHDFTSFEVGQATDRPAANYPQSIGAQNVALAGDWVATEYPSALMERAVCTGREAANHILWEDEIRQASLTVTTSHGPGLF